MELDRSVIERRYPELLPGADGFFAAHSKRLKQIWKEAMFALPLEKRRAVVREGIAEQRAIVREDIAQERAERAKLQQEAAA